MRLPGSSHLSVSVLARCFRNTTATYKFYWFLSILHEIEKGETKVSKISLFSRMISNAWYTVNYFHLSFGQQDQLQRAIERIKTLEGISVEESQESIVKKLKSADKLTLLELWHFDKQVPYRFLRPWFPNLYREHDIYQASKSFSNQCLYSLHEDYIVINPEWYDYLFDNVKLLKGFCYWNLAIFLQARNPNVPDIPNKLIKPAIRNSLTKQRAFWDIVFDVNGPQQCIYTMKALAKDDYAVEHFIPYAFVSHDLIWNLIPADKSFNSSKGDRIPVFEKYFEPFVEMQLKGVETVRRVRPDHKYLQEYLTIFPDLTDIGSLPDEFIKERFKQVIQPLVTIALNNGFEYMS